jgi:hypothetical protein
MLITYKEKNKSKNRKQQSTPSPHQLSKACYILLLMIEGTASSI